MERVSDVLDVVHAKRTVSAYYDDPGFVSVPIDDVTRGRGRYLQLIVYDGGLYIFDSVDDENDGRVLYRDITPDWDDLEPEFQGIRLPPFHSPSTE
jgi:hypothetical protein